MILAAILAAVAGSAGTAELDGLSYDASVETSATGFFRVERRTDGVWQFATPGGHGFYLAANNGPSSMSGDYCPALGYAPFGKTLQEKYGTDKAGKARWAADTRARLLSWGFNAISTWGQPVDGLVGDGLAHLCVVQMGKEFADDTPNCDSNLINNVDISGSFPNVFRPDFAAHCQRMAKEACAARKDDPWVIGWYTDNEITWRGAVKNGADDRAGTGLYDAVVQLPPEHSGRQTLEDFLGKRGLSSSNDVPVEVKQDFLRLVAREYYRITTSAIRAEAPNHLVLGCRFAGLRSTPDIAWEEGGRWNDVMSVNIYPPVDLTNGVIRAGSKDSRPLAESLRERSKLAGRPVIVSEWSFAGMDTECPNKHGAGYKVPTQADRAAAARLMVESMLREPTVVGTIHFRWVDMPPLGRWTLTGGEDSNYGLVNNDDKPYELLTQAFADVHANLYALRAQAALPPPVPRLAVPRATVWRDCTAWYMGGAAQEGAFKNGDMTDLRHAAVADAPTHGGTARGNAEGISNLRETVYGAASGQTFANQRTIRLAQRETTSGDYKVYENGVALPFAATNSNYTLLMRVKLDEAQPRNKEFVYVADLGYGGGTNKYAFAIRYHPATEEIGFLYNNGSGKVLFSPTNEVCPTLRGTWLELSVSLRLLSRMNGKDTCRMRLGVAAAGLERVYLQKDFNFPKGQAVPKDGKIYLAGTTGYGGASGSCAPARGSYQMVSYWERVLTDDEILTAFRIGSLAEGAEDSAAILRIGGADWGEETLGGRIDGESATADLDLQNVGAFSSVLESGQTLRVPFEVIDACTNLAQIVRLVGTAESTAAFSVAVDGEALGRIRMAHGAARGIVAPAGLFTEGAHTLSIRRTDAGASEAKLSLIEIGGSFRIGWEDGTHSELGGDITSAAGTKSYAVMQLTSNAWKTVRSSISSTRIAEVRTELSAEAAATHAFSLRTCPCSYPAQRYRLVIKANDREVFHRTISPDVPYKDHRSDPIEVRFRAGELRAGVNVFSFNTEVVPELDAAPGGTWVRFDHYTLEAIPGKSGFGLLIR